MDNLSSSQTNSEKPDSQQPSSSQPSPENQSTQAEEVNSTSESPEHPPNPAKEQPTTGLMVTIPKAGSASSKATSQLRLEVHAGPLAGKGFPILGDSITFGRSPGNDIVLNDPQVSRYHAVLRRQGDEIILEDLGSTNSTLINGTPLTGTQVLQTSPNYHHWIFCIWCYRVSCSFNR